MGQSIGLVAPIKVVERARPRRGGVEVGAAVDSSVESSPPKLGKLSEKGDDEEGIVAASVLPR